MNRDASVMLTDNLTANSQTEATAIGFVRYIWLKRVFQHHRRVTRAPVAYLQSFFASLCDLPGTNTNLGPLIFSNGLTGIDHQVM